MASRWIGLVGWYLADGYSIKKAVVTQECGNHQERFNFDTTLNQIKQSNKGKRPPEKTEAMDQRKMLNYAYKHSF